MDERLKEFYSRFSGRLLADYVHGNARVEAAIRHALCWISPNAQRILDVGCGIGWSTWEIKRTHPHAFVLGIDLSLESIEIAQALFEGNKPVFMVHDITQCNVPLQNQYDAILMLDVYEHISRERREKLHEALAKSLGPNGVAVLTFPSLSYQQFLRTRHPEGLQPIDEDVTKEDVLTLARALDAEIVDFRHVSIWQADDYAHLMLKRNPKSLSRNGYENASNTNLEPRHVRAHRVESRLRSRVTSDGLILQERDGPVVCVVSPTKNTYSETFIRAHVQGLPATVRLLHGGRLPSHTEDKRPLLPSGVTHRAIRFASSKLLRMAPQYFEKKALKDFLQTNRVDVVLAEYGPTGASIIDSCLAAKVPLVVHFHGYDAYDHKTLEEHALSYPRMFSSASAIIAVSRDMERQLLALGAPREQLFYSPYGVDTDQFWGTEVRVPPTFVAVGRFVDKKAPHLTLLAFKKALVRCSDARLKMVGDGPLWESCKQLARAMDISHAVEFLGPRSHAEVAVTMRQARVFVQHSIRATYGDSEGTPVALLEAGATGLPAVATRHAGIEDVIIDGETGLLVDEGDVEGMAGHMTRLARDPDLAGRMGKAARQRIVEEFSMEISINRLWNIMANCAGLS